MNLRSCSIILAFFLLVKCSMPNAKEVAGRMEKYWDFCKAENYDSLRQFYLTYTEASQKNLNDLFTALHDLREQYGNIKDVNLTGSKTSTSTSDGNKIEFSYRVDYEKKSYLHEFVFRKRNTPDYKIDNQRWMQVDQ